MTDAKTRASELIDSIILDAGLELPDRITCAWQETLDELITSAVEEEREWFLATLRAELPIGENRAVLVMRVQDRSRGQSPAPDAGYRYNDEHDRDAEPAPDALLEAAPRRTVYTVPITLDADRLGLMAACIESGLKKTTGRSHPQSGKFTTDFLQSVATCLTEMSEILRANAVVARKGE